MLPQAWVAEVADEVDEEWRRVRAEATDEEWPLFLDYVDQEGTRSLEAWLQGAGQWPALVPLRQRWEAYMLQRQALPPRRAWVAFEAELAEFDAAMEEQRQLCDQFGGELDAPAPSGPPAVPTPEPKPEPSKDVMLSDSNQKAGAKVDEAKPKESRWELRGSRRERLRTAKPEDNMGKVRKPTELTPDARLNEAVVGEEALSEAVDETLCKYVPDGHLGEPHTPSMPWFVR